MTTIIQWLHLVSAVAAVGGMAFMVIVLMPSLSVLDEERRAQVAKAIAARFRWVSWIAILLLIGTGIYNVRVRAWEAPWGTYWTVLTLKMFLALIVFSISLLLTLPIPGLESFRARRRQWLTITLGIAVAVILISAYLRGF